MSDLDSPGCGQLEISVLSWECIVLEEVTSEMYLNRVTRL